MKYVKWGAGIVVGLVLLFCVVGLLLPKKYHVERSVTIGLPSTDVHPAIDRLQEWPTWTAWTVEKYPDMKIKFSGPEEGPGASYEWDGESTGHGQLTLLTSDPIAGITYTMAFDHGAMPSTGGFKYASGGTGTTVTWYADGDLGWNPINRYFGLLLDGMMGPDFQTGLNNLKDRLESGEYLKEKPVEIPPEKAESKAN